jgi:hypothetical protein
MPNEEEGRKAVEALAGSDFLGRAMSVREARPKEEGKEGGGNGRGKGENGGEGQPRAERPRPEKPKEPEIVVIQRGMY